MRVNDPVSVRRDKDAGAESASREETRFGDNIRHRKGLPMFSGTITGCTQSGALTSHKRTQRGGLFAVTIVVMLLTVIAADSQSVSAQNQPVARSTTIIVRGARSYDCGRFFP